MLTTTDGAGRAGVIAIPLRSNYIEAGHPLSEFLEDFPTLSKEQAIAALSRQGSTARSCASCLMSAAPAADARDDSRFRSTC